ncbi:MAG: 4-hydroxy-tetrahydrodipicolinate synthase [Desulfobacterales bacterium C00003106]|jgi:4-hydroxy-tetrahydrodipicolinate synthase|nr:4-hydroxy-tetrahydrodipicolinate synthase [Pseudomonadota bacterium]MDL1977289.1 4-hydroxy-tetrahydrodipicolinate synthase [Deltaproteobacteria bacterium]OEU54303.1 MAG: 4-hydroxy-tetrahydrodipicolinate synthase [Desulfobacterales bacterium C00003106]OEU60325.1 MAG: 4-hydroxy-tetrahydrodipicolinate synthase [Desulfobacterales bacterium C00003104]
MIRGAIVAIVTPFRDGKVDEEGLRNLIEFQLENGTDAIVPCGTTGESATLDHAEHKMVVETTIDAVHGRVPVIAGTGSNSTAETIELTKHARSAGADAALVITPYYNKPTQEGLFQHFKAVSDACSFPMVLYNVPGRTSVNMLPATVARTAELDDVIGIKEATGSMQQASDIISLCGDKITLLSGDDFTAFPLLSIGGKGVISVVANVAPRDMADMVDAFEAGDMDKARGLHYKLFPLNKAMFYETNPIPAKTTLALMGKISGELRLPMFQMSEANLAKLKKTLTEYGLIS